MAVPLSQNRTVYVGLAARVTVTVTSLAGIVNDQLLPEPVGVTPPETVTPLTV